MKIALFSFTDVGSHLNKKLMTELKKENYFCEGYTVKKFIHDNDLQELPTNMSQWIGNHWGEYTFLFIGATGIAVRYIAPYVKDKYTDSAVLVMDDCGHNIIPLLSGHIGGGIELAEVIAGLSGAVPIITTATDIHQRFAVDTFAKRNQLYITDRNGAKKISAAVLSGESIGFYSDYKVEGTIPQEICKCATYEELGGFDVAFAIEQEPSSQESKEHILQLIPKNLIIGVGCRRGVNRIELEEQLQILLKSLDISSVQIGGFASIDLKADEVGLQDLAQHYHVPFYTYTPEELRGVEIVSEPSAFVKSITGVDNVCERAARRCCPDGKLIQPKIKMKNITFAVVQKEIVIYFK